MSRYSKEHYEDVARLLNGVIIHAEREERFVDVLLVELLVEEFADLFAADSPPACRTHGIIGSERKDDCPNDRGFDRERFLAACELRDE